MKKRNHLAVWAWRNRADNFVERNWSFG